MKFIKRFLPVLLLFMAVFVGTEADVKASASDENINVIVPVTVGVIFNEDGSTTSTTFNVFNRSSVPIEITSVHATELNDWELVSSDTVIGLDTKKLSYTLEGKEILAGNNKLSISVSEMGLHNFDINIKRGAWSYSFDYEEAFLLEFEYAIVGREYALTLDGNEYADSSELYMTEGDTVDLPSLQHDKYEFIGWTDSQGKRYTDSFIMPSSDTTLTAMWKLPTYALFSESDGSLTFVQSEEEIKAGQTHNEKTITSVYSGFDSGNYADNNSVPWFKDGTCKKIYNVVFEDYVFPESTAYWFYGFEYCMSFDVFKLNTFRVSDMSFMYCFAGRSSESSDFVITGMENWDTSHVTSMWGMFEYSGWQAQTYHIGNIGLWDVSNVWDMQSMFYSTAMDATEVYIGDLGMWDTSSLEAMMDMFCDMGWKTQHLNIGNIGTWDVSHVDLMTNAFSNMGEHADTVYIGDLSQWDVSNVEDFSWMFSCMAAHAKEFNVGDLSQWNMTKAEYTSFMFYGSGEYAESFYLGDISKWNVENVYDMSSMFENAGRMADWKLDLSGWNVGSAVRCLDFSTGVEDKITEPIWLY